VRCVLGGEDLPNIMGHSVEASDVLLETRPTIVVGEVVEGIGRGGMCLGKGGSRLVHAREIKGGLMPVYWETSKSS